MNKEDSVNRAFPIRSDADLDRAIELVDALWNAEAGTPEGDLLQVMSDLIDQYERETSTLEPGDPVELIRFKLRELGWSQNKLARQTGYSSGRISEILNRRRPLTIAMVQKLSTALGLPAGLLVHDVNEHAQSGQWVCLPSQVARQANATAKQLGVPLTEFVNACVSRAATNTQGTAVLAYTCQGHTSEHTTFLVDSSDAPSDDTGRLLAIPTASMGPSTPFFAPSGNRCAA